VSVPHERFLCRPLRDSVLVFLLTPDLRPGLMNAVASRLEWGGSVCALRRSTHVPSGAKARIKCWPFNAGLEGLLHPRSPAKLRGLRGAETPLFHVTAGVVERLRSCPSRSAFLGGSTGWTRWKKQRQRQHRRCGRPWFPPFAKAAKDGAPSFDKGVVEVKINVNGNGQECPFHTGEVKGSWASPLKPKDGLNGPPAFAGNTRSAESRQTPRLRIHAGTDEFLIFLTASPSPKESSPLEQPAQDNENSAGLFCRGAGGQFGIGRAISHGMWGRTNQGETKGK